MLAARWRKYGTGLRHRGNAPERRPVGQESATKADRSASSRHESKLLQRATREYKSFTPARRGSSRPRQAALTLASE